MYDTGLLTYSLRCELRDEALSTEIIRDDGSLDINYLDPLTLPRTTCLLSFLLCVTSSNMHLAMDFDKRTPRLRVLRYILR